MKMHALVRDTVLKFERSNTFDSETSSGGPSSPIAALAPPIDEICSSGGEYDDAEFWCCQRIPPIEFMGTVKGPSHENFEPVEAARSLKKAFRGLGTDEKIIISILAYHTNWQRQEIRRSYYELFQRNLVEDLVEELGGHFLETILALMQPPHLYDAQCLRKAMKSYYVQDAGMNEVILIELLYSRSPTQVNLIKQAYTEQYGKNLEDDVATETSPLFCKLINAVISGIRDQKDNNKDSVDLKNCEKDAARLLQVGIKTTETGVFNEILANRSAPHLRRLFGLYKKTSGKDIEQEIRKQFTGDIKDGYLALIKLARSPPSLFAQKLHDCIRGSMSDDETIIRVIVSRSEIDLQQVKQEYLRRYKTTLAKSIKDDTSGDYSRLLLKIIGRD